MIGELHRRICEVTRAIVDAVAERGECDFVVDVAAELPLQVIAELMGVPHDDRRQLYEWTNQIAGSQDPEYRVAPDVAQRAALAMFEYANELATYKRANPGDDITTVLLDAEVDGERLTESEFDFFFELLVIAGNETTRNLISHGMLALIEHPSQRALLLAEPQLLDSAIEEMLRYASPIMYMRRTAVSDLELQGKTIRPGDKVTLWYAAANRDPDVFADPHGFDIARSPNDHATFGAGGPHYCLGSHLARLETKVMFEEILVRIPDMELAGNVQRLRSNFVNGIKHMPVTFTPS